MHGFLKNSFKHMRIKKEHNKQIGRVTFRHRIKRCHKPQFLMNLTCLSILLKSSLSQMKCSLHCKKDILLTASGQYVSVLASCSHLSVCLQFDHLLCHDMDIHLQTQQQRRCKDKMAPSLLKLCFIYFQSYIFFITCMLRRV